jgi:hypothetical protein
MRLPIELVRVLLRGLWPVEQYAHDCSRSNRMEVIRVPPIPGDIIHEWSNWMQKGNPSP